MVSAHAVGYSVCTTFCKIIFCYFHLYCHKTSHFTWPFTFMNIKFFLHHASNIPRPSSCILHSASYNLHPSFLILHPTGLIMSSATDLCKEICMLISIFQLLKHIARTVHIFPVCLPASFSDIACMTLLHALW